VADSSVARRTMDQLSPVNTAAGDFAIYQPQNAWAADLELVFLTVDRFGADLVTQYGFAPDEPAEVWMRSKRGDEEWTAWANVGAQMAAPASEA
jgi:hypothetical protein